MNKKNYLVIEAPDTSATVDFLHLDTVIEAKHDPKDRTITINVKISDGEGSSTWQEREMTIQLSQNI